MKLIDFLIITSLILFIIYFLTFFDKKVQENYTNNHRESIDYHHYNPFKSHTMKRGEQVFYNPGKTEKELVDAFEANNYPCNAGYHMMSSFWLD